MRYPQLGRPAGALAAAVTVSLLPAAGVAAAHAPAAPAPAAAPAPQVHVNQAGYPRHSPKVAYAGSRDHPWLALIRR